MVEWSTDTQTGTTLSGRCMTIDGPQRICPENKEINSNSLNTQWLP